MTARKCEAALLKRCVVVARDITQAALDQREANVFRVAAMVIRSRFYESMSLTLASEQYFDLHPHEQLASAEVVRKGWIIGLPRLRDRLCCELGVR